MNSGVGTQVIRVSALRTRMFSRLVKKCILSRLIGPPMLKPSWWRVNSPFSMLVGLVVVGVGRELVAPIELVGGARKLFVPDFVSDVDHAA